MIVATEGIPGDKSVSWVVWFVDGWSSWRVEAFNSRFLKPLKGSINRTYKSIKGCSLGQSKFSGKKLDKLHTRIWAKRWPFSNLDDEKAMKIWVRPFGLGESTYSYDQEMLKWQKNWYALTFWPKVPHRVWGIFPPKIWTGLGYRQEQNESSRWKDIGG